MKNLKKLILLFCFLPMTLTGQETAKVFTQDQLMWFLEKYHPVAAQGNLLLQQGESNLRAARGAFDPTLQNQLNQKQYDSKQYQSLLNVGLKVPTWYGIELQSGYDQNRGAFLNPENSVPENGLWYAGISVPLGQGLFMDQRRATLQQAKLFATSTQVERQKLMNDLYFDAIKQYWKWVEAWNQYNVYEESVSLAFERYEGVKQSHLFGELPAIDTLEAFLQVQNRQMNRNQALLRYQTTTLELSNFLWAENNTPLVLTDSVRPPAYEEINIAASLSPTGLYDLLNQVETNHPDMQLYGLKLDAMEIDRRLKTEGLKPKLNLNYNALNEPVGSNFAENTSLQNYKWGVTFSIPLLLRKERGEFQLSKLKIQDTQLGREQKLLELKNKLKTYYAEQLNLQNQVTLYTEAVKNYNLLLEGEKQKFFSGESSLFLINSRETNLIQGRLKLIELLAKYQIANSGLIWATGRLY